MTAQLGVLLTCLDALGSEDGSEEMLAAMRLAGTAFEIDEFASAGMQERCLVFRRGGVDMLVVDGILAAIFFRLAESRMEQPIGDRTR